MIKKIIAFLIVIGAIGGGTWFLLSNAPAKSVEKLRKRVDVLLKSKDPNEWNSVTTSKERSDQDLNDIKVRIQLARQASDAILEIYPNSEYDLNKRGNIEEFAGSPKDALKWYDKIASLRNPPAINELRRARILEKMGAFQAAKGAISSIVDVYPYESNFELGRMNIETFQPLNAYRSYNRAKEYVNNDSELRQVLEGIANSVDLLISSTRNQLEILRRKNADDKRIVSLTNVLKKLQSERDRSLDQALKLMDKVEPASRGQFVGIQIKTFELINKKDDADRLKTARQKLIDAVSSDEDLRYFPIYLLLASVDLHLAYRTMASPDKRSEFTADAINNFKKALAFDFEGKNAKVADIAEWDLSEHLSQEEFEAKILLRICKNLLNYPEYWRILSDQAPDTGEKEILEIHRRLPLAVEANQGNESLIEEIKSVQALAMLKNNDVDAYKELTRELLVNSSPEKRPQMALKLARGIMVYAADHLNATIELLEDEVLGKIQSLEQDEGQSLVQARAGIGILNKARYKQYLSGARHRNEDEEKYKLAIEKIDVLTAKIRDNISRISQISTTPNHYLFASQLMISLVGTQEALDVLRQANKSFPDDYQIRFNLGMLYLNLASKDTEQGPWGHLHDALKEFLFLYQSRPYQADALSRLFSIGAQFRSIASSPDIDLKDAVAEIFPAASDSDAKLLSEILATFFQQDFENTVKQLPEGSTAKGVRPFLNLIGGISYLELANMAIKDQLAHNPLISGKSQPPGDQDRFYDFYQKARADFENGLTIDSAYLPIKLELIKMDLNAIKSGEGVSEELIDQLKDYRKQYPEIPQIHFLLGMAKKKELEVLIVDNTKLSAMSRVLSRQRAALRRAVKTNPQYSEAYVALAETYVIPWRLAKGPLM